MKPGRKPGSCGADEGFVSGCAGTCWAKAAAAYSTNATAHDARSAVRPYEADVCRRPVIVAPGAALRTLRRQQDTSLARGMAKLWTRAAGGSLWTMLRTGRTPRRRRPPAR